MINIGQSNINAPNSQFNYGGTVNNNQQHNYHPTYNNKWDLSSGKSVDNSTHTTHHNNSTPYGGSTSNTPQAGPSNYQAPPPAQAQPTNMNTGAPAGNFYGQAPPPPHQAPFANFSHFPQPPGWTGMNGMFPQGMGYGQPYYPPPQPQYGPGMGYQQNGAPMGGGYPGYGYPQNPQPMPGASATPAANYQSQAAPPPQTAPVAPQSPPVDDDGTDRTGRTTARSDVE